VGSKLLLTGHDDAERSSSDAGRVLDDARVVPGVRLQRTDDTQHAFKRPHRRRLAAAAGSDFPPVRTDPSAARAKQTTDNVSGVTGGGQRGQLPPDATGEGGKTASPNMYFMINEHKSKYDKESWLNYPNVAYRKKLSLVCLFKH